MQEETPSTPLADPVKKSPLSKPILYSIGGGGLVVIAALTYGVLAYVHQTKKPATSPTPATPTTAIKPTPTPTATPIPKIASFLDGVLAEPGKENIHPLAVMIENHPDARPQAGLGQASLVYEAIAEGGITRFMAIYKDPSIPVRVGPIRSSRTYFLHFANEIHALYAHAGGNRDALDEIAAGDTPDLDGLIIGDPVFKRDYSRGVASEHTLYSSTDSLWNFATVKNHWSQIGNYKPWNFQDDPASNKRPVSQLVNVSVSDSLYAVQWNYDTASNSYLRTMAGTPHKDADTGAQIAVKNIVIETVNRQQTVTRSNEQGWIYTTTGSGPAVVIQNGIAIKGTWKHTDERTRYYDESGKEISFTRGTTWVHIVHPDSIVSY
jgi:hypothetical protein